MAVFTKRFANTDEYEKWLEEAGERISVVSVTNPPAMYGWSTQPGSGPIAITYETDDESLAPARRTAAKIAAVVLIAAFFFAVFLYLASKV
jgi:hypothetical protein